MASNTNPPKDCGRPHPQQYCACQTCAHASKWVLAQHDETGRQWQGPRWKIPARYAEIVDTENASEARP